METLTEEEEEFAATLGAVHQAVLDNNPAKLEKLIQEDYPLDERDAHSLTPLHLVRLQDRTQLSCIMFYHHM